MNPWLAVINSFIEDTCVITVAAYFLGRGQILSTLFRFHSTLRDAATLGICLGLVGLTDVIFPGARFPYTVDTLMAAYAASVGGLRVGLPCAAIISLGSFALQPSQTAAETTLLIFVSVSLIAAIRDRAPMLGERFGRIVLGAMSQAIVVFLEGLLYLHGYATSFPLGNIASIPANAFGLLVVQLVLNDAYDRRLANQARLEAERSKSLVTQAQLVALRARVHPHFLFNTLASIAGLIRIAPDKAETAIVNLGSFMRNTLESSDDATITLKHDIDNVRVFLDIEKNRLGDRLHVEWAIEPGAETIPVPPFAVQTMVENAIKHGIAPKVEASTLTIEVRLRDGAAVVAVMDDGVGMDSQTRRKVLAIPESGIDHGLQLLSQQLMLLYGQRCRVRLFSKEDYGTLVVFCVPFEKPPELEEVNEP